MARRAWLLAVVAGGVLFGAIAAPGVAAAASTDTSYTGTTTDGAQWVADVPTPWNGTVLLYSHGFGPLTAADAPDPVTKAALLQRGYAMVGSSYDPSGSWWALGSALRDQFQALHDVRADLPSEPQHVLAFGTSMGGLISALEDEPNPYGHVDGSLTTCGIVAGGIQLNNYQLDGEYAMNQLLAPAESIDLVDYTNPIQGIATGGQLTALATGAQSTPQGRARLALAMALMNVSPGVPAPSPWNVAAEEAGQYQVEFSGAFDTMDFVEFARAYINAASGGNGSWTAGVNFAELLDRSSYAPEVRALYRAAGLDLDADLANLTQHAGIQADPAAIRWLQQTSVPTGNLQGPELDLHTIADQLVPDQQENYYRHTVQTAGKAYLLRQAFADAQGHCNFTPGDLVAGVLALQHRIATGGWGWTTTPSALNAVADELGSSLGGGNFARYYPPPLSGNNGPYNPGEVSCGGTSAPFALAGYEPFRDGGGGCPPDERRPDQGSAAG